MIAALFAFSFLVGDNSPKSIQAELKSLTEISSGSDNEAGLEATAAFLIPLFKSLGFETKWNLETRSLVASRTARSKKLSIFFVGHIDTVFSKDSPFQKSNPVTYPTGDWRRNLGPAFRGPGAADAKGGIVLMLEILRNLPSDLRDVIQFHIFLAADEERGSHQSVRPLEELIIKEKPDLAFVFEPGWIEKDGPRIPLRIAGNLHLHLQVTRPSEHAAISPLKGLSAVDGLLDTISQLRLLRNQGLAMNFFDVNSQSAANVTPQSAEARLAVRFQNEADRQQIFKEIARIKNRLHSKGFALQILSEKTIALPQEVLSQENLRFIQTVSRSLGQSIPQSSIAMGRGAESFLARMNVRTFPAMGPYGIDFHSELETVFLNSFHERALLCHGILRKLLEGKTRSD